MSEDQKAPRPLDEIHKEYTNACFKAGNLQYQISALSKDLALLNDTMRELNFEAAAVKAAEKQPAAAEGATNVS